MISKLSLDLDLSDKHMGELLKDINSSDIDKNGIPLYIPFLMSNIEKGAPRVYQANTLSKLVFVNDVNNKPGVNASLKQQNYLLVPKENNSSTEYITSNNKLERGTKVQCSFTHSLLSKPVFNTDINYE